MRTLVLLAALGLAGCGSLVPYSLAPDWLAPDVVPEREASAIVLLDRQPDDVAGVLRGRVVDVATGRPVPGAIVSAEGTTTGDVTTGADGAFALAGNPDGEALLSVEAPGYVPATGTVVLNGAASLLVMLSPSGADPVSEGA